MNILRDIYKKTIAENEKNIRFWEEYRQNLCSLDFAVYSDRLTVPVLVPVGNRILFRGNLKHTNEVTVALGADYFVKCSIKQAEILRQHRIKDAKSKLEIYYKEKEFLENQQNFNQQNIHEGQDIIEHCTEEEDRVWRAAHRERVRQYNQSSAKKETNDHSNIDDDELWMRLEELELKEELENELSKIETDTIDNKEEENNSFVLNKENINNEHIEEVAIIPHSIPQQTSKIDLLKHVIDRQKVLETQIKDLKKRDKIKTSTEDDLLSRLDEIEQLEELEDEIERLDDILDENSDEDSDSEEEEEEESVTVKKSVSKQTVTFNDDDNETLELTFKHSEFESTHEPYDSNKGIKKPSDLYSAFSHLFVNETKSILKKSKYKSNVINEDLDKQNKSVSILDEQLQYLENRTIVINDVTEKNECNNKEATSGKRPVSIFKKKRQLQKS